MLIIIGVSLVWINGFHGFLWWKYVILLFWRFDSGPILLQTDPITLAKISGGMLALIPDRKEKKHGLFIAFELEPNATCMAPKAPPSLLCLCSPSTFHHLSPQL